MSSRTADLKFVEHRAFGPGVVFGSRTTDSGEAADTWFLRDERLRTVLVETLGDLEKPELTPGQRKALRAASAEYRKSHKQRAKRTAVYKPRLKKQFRDRLHKGEFRHVGYGHDLAPEDADQGLAAEVTP